MTVSVCLVDDQHFLAVQLLRFPAHAGVEGHAENIAARAVDQHVRRQRQLAGGTRSIGCRDIDGFVALVVDFLDGHGRLPPTVG